MPPIAFKTSHGLRSLGACLLIVLAAVWVAWLGFRPQVMGDYPADYAPAMNALLAGHIGAFFAHLPTNGAGGSVLIRAPGALLGKLLIGGQQAIFRFGALMCELITAAVALMVAREMRAVGRSAIPRAAVVGLFLLVPAALDAVMFGHPEESLGAALCIAAVLLAAGDRAELAGLVLGLAIINKPWGVLAVFPALLATPGRRLTLAGVAGAIVAAWTASAYLVSPSHFGRTLLGASTSVVAHPVDLWWPVARLRSVPGITPAYFPPRLISEHARELAVFLSLPLALLLARRRWPRRPPVQACLALLALLFLLRCLLDPSNHVYYQVPFVLALAAWEARTRGVPVIALLSAAGFWLVFHTVAATGSLSAQYVTYMALTVMLAAMLAKALFGAAPGIVPARDRQRIDPGVSRSVAS